MVVKIDITALSDDELVSVILNPACVVENEG